MAWCILSTVAAARWLLFHAGPIQLGSCLTPVVPGSVLRIGGIRYVAPYDQEVRLRLQKFAGQRLCDVIDEAVGSHRVSPSWWSAEFRAGRVCIQRCEWGQVRLEPVGADYIVRQGDRVHLSVHMHERATPDVVPTIVYEDAEFIAVSKPAGVDIFANPSGGNVKSSVVGMLAELGYKKLLPAHRIDKPVSGVVCMAKTSKALSRMVRCIKRRAVRKTYLARVCTPDGLSPEGLELNAPLNITDDPVTGKSRACVDPEGGKRALTEVQRVLRSFGDGTALLAIGIDTGRFHQIRCHMDHAGFPIANDPVYGGRTRPGQLLWQDDPAGSLRSLLEQNSREHCEGCAYFKRVLAGTEPAPRLEQTIWLHSWRYEFPSLGLDFEAPPPPWASGTGDGAFDGL